MPLPSIKTNLKQIDRKDNVLVWLGHSSLFIQVDGVRFLVDPVLVTGSPVPFANKPFPGTEVYTPDDMPDIDYLLITHDHFDHLDYKAVTRLRGRIGKVICGLGVGENFRRWKFSSENIIELDWNESVALKEGIALHVLPARHYSGRASFGSDNTLWVSFMIEAPASNIFISGDTGYDIHFFEIGQKFPKIDLAILENGQYGYDWRDIHIMPDDFAQIIKDLNSARTFTTHYAKYALARHTWKDPLEHISRTAEQEGFNLITPMLGELVYLNDFTQEFTKWWEDIE
jgi:L-ascorbate metabolism protein UlaG (beta-lactamase superfamily)